MTAVGQKRPKLLRLPVAKSATRGMAKIAPKAAVAGPVEVVHLIPLHISFCGMPCRRAPTRVLDGDKASLAKMSRP
jgi:hypothetical protein